MGNKTSTPQIEPPDHDSTSSTHDTTSTPSSFETILDAAFTKYKDMTGYDLLDPELASEIDRHDPLDKIVAIFQKKTEEFDKFRKNDDPKLITRLEPVVRHLHTFFSCPAVTAGVDIFFPPTKRIFSAISVLLSTAKSVGDSYGALAEIFECIGYFLLRLRIYTEIEKPRDALTEVVIKIMAELISVLTLATKQIKEGKFKKYGKKFLGDKEIEAVLQRLKRLTLEESKAAVAQTLDIVNRLVKSMEVVMKDGKASLGNIQTILGDIQKIEKKANKTERDQLQDKFQRWLSPPDPWMNYNRAREALQVHEDTATGAWFTQGDIMEKWKSSGRLLWVQGLPGSGKTFICANVIKDIKDMCLTGLDTLSIFYFDFQDKNKQKARNLLSSVLIQLCHQSNQFSEILSSVYSDHRHSGEPDITTLLECLKTMFAVQGQGTHYIVVDALDESPDSSGNPPRREQVLKILKELIELDLPHTRFCFTSRPEADIRSVLEPLNPYNVSLQNEEGQNIDLAEYVKSFVDSDATMRKWPEDKKELVIKTLSKKGRGMFRWAYCQLDSLKKCPQRDIPTALEELPKSLDETYKRMLENIPEKLQKYAHPIFQCLTVSSRPLGVEELAEVFAFDFDVETSGVPKFDPKWRDPNAETAVLSACSTLVAVVNVHGKKVVQFSHFSVREYLTSDRIKDSPPTISHFHIPLKPAHTLLAKTCLSVLLQLDDTVDRTKIQNFPLAWYATEYWLDHARFEDVSSDVRDAMDCLFDKNIPHFAAWLWLYDVDHSWRRGDDSPHPTHPDAVPLYYAALCGLHNLSGRLLDAHPDDVNARGGYHVTPLLASLNRGHPDIALLLLERGADAETRGRQYQTALYVASSRGYVEVVRSLIDRGADLNVECGDGDEWGEAKWTPLHVASKNGMLEVARLLLGHGAGVNYQDNRGRSALHIASCHGSNNIVRLLLDHGANAHALDNWDETALHDASSGGQITIVKSLLEYGANVDAQSKLGSTPLHNAAMLGHFEVIQLLLDHGADVNAQEEDRWTSLHLAAFCGHVQVVEVLLKRGADPHARTDNGETPFQLASSRLDRTQIMRLLSERTGEKM